MKKIYNKKHLEEITNSLIQNREAVKETVNVMDKLTSNYKNIIQSLSNNQDFTPEMQAISIMILASQSNTANDARLSLKSDAVAKAISSLDSKIIGIITKEILSLPPETTNSAVCLQTLFANSSDKAVSTILNTLMKAEDTVSIKDRSTSELSNIISSLSSRSIALKSPDFGTRSTILREMITEIFKREKDLNQSVTNQNKKNFDFGLIINALSSMQPSDQTAVMIEVRRNLSINHLESLLNTNTDNIDDAKHKQEIAATILNTYKTKTQFINGLDILRKSKIPSATIGEIILRDDLKEKVIDAIQNPIFLQDKYFVAKISSGLNDVQNHERLKGDVMLKLIQELDKNKQYKQIANLYEYNPLATDCINNLLMRSALSVDAFTVVLARGNEQIQEFIPNGNRAQNYQSAIQNIKFIDQENASAYYLDLKKNGNTASIKSFEHCITLLGGEKALREFKSEAIQSSSNNMSQKPNMLRLYKDAFTDTIALSASKMKNDLQTKFSSSSKNSAQNKDDQSSGRKR